MLINDLNEPRAFTNEDVVGMPCTKKASVILKFQTNIHHAQVYYVRLINIDDLRRKVRRLVNGKLITKCKFEEAFRMFCVTPRLV